MSESAGASIIRWYNFRENSANTKSKITMSIINNKGKDPGDIRINIPSENSPLDPGNREINDPPNDGNNNTLNVRSREDEAIPTNSDKNPSVKYWVDIFVLIFSLLAYLYDHGSDIYLMIHYFIKKQVPYGCLTLILFITALIASAWISNLMYKEDSLQEEREADGREGRERNDKDNVVKKKSKPIRWNPFHLFCRRCRILQLLCKKNGDTYAMEIVKKQADAALLDVIESFIESAPQLVLQFTILLGQDGPITIWMWFKLFGGCIALAWLMKSHHCASRLAESDQNQSDISYIGHVLIFLWYFGTITAQIFLISIAAHCWLFWTLFAHLSVWIGWTIWLYTREGDWIIPVFCRTKPISASVARTAMDFIRPVLFTLIIVVVYTFTFVNVKKVRPTCTIHTIYYILSGLEFSIIIIATLVLETDESIRKNLVIPVVLFVIGIAAMLIYYIFCHPTTKSRSLMATIKSLWKSSEPEGVEK